MSTHFEICVVLYKSACVNVYKITRNSKQFQIYENASLKKKMVTIIRRLLN